MNKQDCIKLIKDHIIFPTHSLGQNFLIDEDATQEIIAATGLTKSYNVVEIGPGLGALTEQLCEEANFVYAIEIDMHLLEALQETLKDKTNVKIYNEDFLKISKKAIFEDENAPFVIVSNLPYYAMTPIMMKLFREWGEASTMVFTVEAAACDRIFAQPGSKSYGPLAVFTQLYGSSEQLFLLDSKSFHPAPHTKSAVIRLVRSGKLQDTPSVIYPLVQAAFAQRRKTLLNALTSSGLFPDGKKQVEALLLDHGISPKIRAEQLSPEDFISLAQGLLPK